MGFVAAENICRIRRWAMLLISTFFAHAQIHVCSCVTDCVSGGTENGFLVLRRFVWAKTKYDSSFTLLDLVSQEQRFIYMT